LGVHGLCSLFATKILSFLKNYCNISRHIRTYPCEPPGPGKREGAAELRGTVRAQAELGHEETRVAQASSLRTSAARATFFPLVPSSCLGPFPLLLTERLLSAIIGLKEGLL
jgi:hypothetical protein